MTYRYREDPPLPPRPSPILLPGTLCDARLWRGGGSAIVDVLEERLTPPVHDADLSCDDSIAAMADRALASVAGRLLPVGFSMGAIVAVEMWCQAPDRIAGMILLDYNAAADLPERALHRPRHQAEARAGGLERLLVEEMMPNYLGSASCHDQRLLDLVRDMAMDLGPEIFVRQSEALRTRTDRQAALGMIDVPVLLGCGDEDVLTPLAWHALWTRLVRGSDVFSVAGAGHMLPLEAPAAVAARIDRWLSEQEKAWQVGS